MAHHRLVPVPHGFDPTCGCAGCERRGLFSQPVKVPAPEPEPGQAVIAVPYDRDGDRVDLDHWIRDEDLYALIGAVVALGALLGVMCLVLL